MKKLLATVLALLALALPLGALAEGMEDSPYTVFDGINLTGELGGEEIEMTLVYQNEDRTNFAEYLVDGTVVVSYERLGPVADMAGAQERVRELLADQGVEPRDMTIAPDEAVSARLEAEAYSLSYSIGAQGDMLLGQDVFVRAGEWSYRFHTLTPEGAYQQYQEDIAQWIASLALEEMTGPANYDEAADAYPRLTMPLAGDQIELTDYEQYSDIEYEQWYAYEGGDVLFSYERYLPCADDLAAVTEATTGMYDSVSALTGARDDALTAQLGHPAYRVEYLTGDEGASWQNVDVFVLMEDCALCFHVEADAGVYDDYHQVIEGWLSTLSIADAGA